jgi:hypothetical protein
LRYGRADSAALAGVSLHTQSLLDIDKRCPEGANWIKAFQMLPLRAVLAPRTRLELRRVG